MPSYWNPFLIQIPSARLLIHSFFSFLLPRYCYHFPTFLPPHFFPPFSINPQKENAAMSGGAQGEINTLKNIKLSILRGRSIVNGSVYVCALGSLWTMCLCVRATICLFCHLFIKVTTPCVISASASTSAICLSGTEGSDGV